MKDKKTIDDKETIMDLRVKIDKVLTNQEKMLKDINVIKTDIFEPDNGIYARVNRNTGFRQTAVKWLWVLTMGLTISMARSLMELMMK